MQLERYAALASLAILASCVDAPVEPRTSALSAPSLSVPSLSRGGFGSVACTTTGATVVGTESALRATLATAQPGDVVAVTGAIDIVGTLRIRIPEGVTLTCAEPGAALSAVSWRYNLLYVNAPNVTVSGLSLKTSHTDWPVFVLNGDSRTDVSGFRMAGNSVDCGWAGCLFVVGAPGSVISHNSFDARHRTSTGIHLQGGGNRGTAVFHTSNSLVEGNVLTAHLPVGAPSFGAIRPRDGKDIILRRNHVRGPWSNGIATTEVDEALFEHNTVDGATRFGMFFALILNRPITVRGSLFRNNDLTSTGGAAIFAQRACNNVFLANRLTPKAGHPTIAFAATTGANAVLGVTAGIEDNGNQDCNGDGVADPNTISGKTRRGGYAGEIIGPVMQNAGRTDAQ